MLKSYVEDLTSVYLGIFRDAKYAFPTLESELVKDQRRLLTLVGTRGLPFLMVDLANLGKHLDRCLSAGKYTPSGLPASQPVSTRVQIPKLFRGLYLLVFNSDGSLKEDVDVEALCLLRQFLMCAKRADIACSSAAIEDAFDAFIAVDGSLPVPHSYWSDESVAEVERTIFPGFAQDALYQARADQAQVKHTSLAVLDRVIQLLAPFLGRYSIEEEGFSHGHGSVSNLPNGEDRYQFLNWDPMLDTAFPIADVAFHNYSSWASNEGLEREIPWSGDALTSITLNVHCEADSLPRKAIPDPVDLHWHVGDLSFPSKLMAVTKTLTKPRLIASEPFEHMFCQQSIRRFIYRRVEDSLIGQFIKFDDQSQNQEFCMRGSVDGSLATIDLSEASDRVTCQCVGNTFRHNLLLLRALRAARSQRCSVPDRGEVELRKFSTMGNATTFPVQSLVFLFVALAGCLEDVEGVVTLNDIRALVGKVSVFGDDIIVPNEKVGSVVAILECLHFKVNTQKSFFHGRFRESCGVDAFRGTNITPVYWRRLFDGSPESYSSSVETANNFYKKFLVETSRVVEASVQKGSIRIPTVPVLSGVLGFESFVVPDTRAKRRWNEGLQVDEMYLPCLVQRSEVRKTQNDTAMLQFFVELPDPQTKWESGVRSRPVLSIRHRWVSVDQLAPRAPTDVRIGVTPPPPHHTVQV
jgi:hypothetical protein